MSKFKVGDKVKIVKSTGSRSDFYWAPEMDSSVGKIGTILDYSDYNGTYKVVINIDSYVWQYLPESLELCQEQSKTDTANPKAQYGLAKLPLHLWSPLATAYGAVCLGSGAGKYGIGNYKSTEVQASIYIAATMRHLLAWLEGEENDPKEGTPHLGHILANVAIILDARAKGTLIDDRPVAGGYLKELDMLTEIYQKVMEMHKDKNPKHYYMNEQK